MCVPLFKRNGVILYILFSNLLFFFFGPTKYPLCFHVGALQRQAEPSWLVTLGAVAWLCPRALLGSGSLWPRFHHHAWHSSEHLRATALRVSRSEISMVRIASTTFRQMLPYCPVKILHRFWLYEKELSE